jgi:hypothetical protein
MARVLISAAPRSERYLKSAGDSCFLNEWARSLDAVIASTGSSAITGGVYDAKERFLGRLDIERMRGTEGWMPSELRAANLSVWFVSFVVKDQVVVL